MDALIRARTIAECLIGDRRHRAGELLELTHEQFERLQRARCVEPEPDPEPVADPSPDRRPPKKLSPRPRGSTRTRKRARP